MMTKFFWKRKQKMHPLSDRQRLFYTKKRDERENIVETGRSMGVFCRSPALFLSASLSSGSSLPCLALELQPRLLLCCDI
jgi:hypothetical protein